MEKYTSASKNSAGMGMYEFFYEEFQTLRARTGIRQWEMLNDLPKEQAAKEIHTIIDFMCQECNKPPFDIVRPEVKQRVIARAVVEDQDFIGLNAKFVRKALNAWWVTNGDRVIEAINQKEAKVYERVELTPDQKAKIDVMANTYVARLLQGDGPKPIPKLEPDEIKKEGKEWKSELERKAVSVEYRPPSDEDFQTQDRIRKAGSELYKGRLDLHLKLFKVDRFQIFAESQVDAEQIYNIAKQG